jgi:DNA-binding NtrC family response regulator
LSEKPKILVVDDDKSIRASMSMILEEEGYLVDTAETGSQALEKAKTNFYNMALLDFKLPDMEGTELLTQIKDTTPRMRKIMITGYPTIKNAVESVNSGADGFIIKPFNVNEVLGKVKEHLKKQKEESQYSQSKVTEYIESQFRETASSTK